MSKKVIYIFIFSLMSSAICAQKNYFTHADTLRGSITNERKWWDLKHYNLNYEVNLIDSTFKGSNIITYKVLSVGNTMQIDLQTPMKITAIKQDNLNLTFKKDGSAYFVKLIKNQAIGSTQKVQIFYEGKPKVSVNPPWSGGVTWSKDKDGNSFLATTCQGDGASLWWPCKDHMYDEPDSMLMQITVDQAYTAVGNGKLRSVKKLPNNKAQYIWVVKNPINNYGVNVNIAKYEHFKDVYMGENGKLSCDYYVLKEDLDSAKKQFKQAHQMLKAFEHWFGPYPFYEDGYKLVQVPYAGMEHQSSITYGNGFKNGYKHKDVSHTQWGQKFDFIIIHESGHEWFANNITYKDAADMWIHESFTSYAEAIYVDYYYGKEASSEYILGMRKDIKNDRPLIGVYHVNYAGSSDIYNKGANMLHTLRQLVKDDAKWNEILRGMNREFYHQTVTSTQIEDYLTKATGINLKPFFDQYLRDTRVPILEYQVLGNNINFKWNNCVEGFNMPAKIKVNGEWIWVYPNQNWNAYSHKEKINEAIIDPNLYILTIGVN